jgi:hypothetical protein
MLDGLEAERLKLARHRATWFLVWIYPIGLTLISLIYLAWQIANPNGLEGMPKVPETAASWMADTASPWGGPASTFGRYLISAFAAVAFAGEYGWNTWKLIVPHRARLMLMAAKYVTVLGLLYAAFLLTALLSVAFSFIGDAVTSDPIPRGVTPGGIVTAHAKAALAGLPAVLLTLAYTSLAAVITRSTIAALIIGVVVATAEQVFGQFAPLIALVAQDLVWFLYHVLPGYHLGNLRSLIAEGKALRTAFPNGVVELSWAISLTTIAAWAGALVALAVGLFRRQDLN